MELKCAVCEVQACREAPGSKPHPRFCPMSPENEGQALSEARATYSDRETQLLARAAARTEAAGYCKEPRVEEVMGFARRLGVHRLGIASCVGLIREARLLQEILEANGFEVFSVCCKVGSIPKEEIGLSEEEKIRPGQFEALCNPIAQALLLNEAGTGLNIVVGLCVGHDSLFFRHSAAPVTVLVAKDRVTGHNPAAALYTSHSYYRRLREVAG
ncbi:MAG: metal-binding protein [Chloroflexi bacterium]|nr:MAG: metal-binding protein [Chloroflexota bacterium]